MPKNKHKHIKSTTMANKVIIWPNSQAPHNTHYWLLPETQWESESPEFTTDLGEAELFDENEVEAIVTDINANNPSLQVYSGNPTSPPPPPPGL